MKTSLAALALMLAACGTTQAPTAAPAAPTQAATPAPEDAQKLACDSSPEALARSDAAPLASAFEDATGRVVRVDVKGTDQISAEKVKSVLHTRAGSDLDEATLREDVERVWALGGLDDVSVSARRDPGGVVLELTLVPLPKLRNVFVSTPDSQNQSQNQNPSELGLSPGGVFRRVSAEQALRQLQSEWMNQGYPRARARLGGRRLGDGRVDVCVHLDRGAKILVRNVVLDGNRAITTAELIQAMATDPGLNTPGGVYRADALELSVLKIQALYFDRGMPTAEVSSPRVDIGDDGIDIEIRIVEGAEYRLGAIHFDGDLVTTKKGYERLVHSKAGEPFSRAKLLEDIERIRQMHEAQKHPEAVVEPQVRLDPDKHLVDLTFVVHDQTAPAPK